MWKFLTTNPLGWATLAAGTIAALAFGVKKYNDAIEEAKESARERTSELLDEFNQMNDTLADHKKTVSDLADRYTELSKGVNLSTNKNVSLSTEEYDEFLNINEQLATSFPELAKGIDENGNSILTLGTKGITAKEQLEELLQTEEDLNNFRVAQGLEEAFKGVYTYVEDANKATEKLNGSISDSSEAIGKLQDIAENGIKISGENNQLIISGNTNNQAELNYLNALTNSVNEFWESLDPNRRVQFDPSTLFLQNNDQTTGTFKLYANTYGLTADEITELENIIRDNVGDASSALLDSISDQSQELQEQINKSENAWTDFIPTLVSGMKSKQTFKNLDSDLQGIAIQIVEGLDYSYANAMKEWDPDPYAYVRDKIIDPLSNLDDAEKEKLTSSFEELFKLDAENLSQSNQAEIEKLITTIATLLEKDPLEIRVALGFDIKDTQNRYNAALNKAKHQFDGYSYNDRGVEATNEIGRTIQDFWNENVTTEEDWTLWEKVTVGIEDATDAMNVYTEAKKDANNVELIDDSFIPTISSSIQQLATQLEPQFAKLGEAYKEIFQIDEKTGKEIFSLNNVDNSMLDGLREAFGEIEEEVGVIFDASMLEPFFDILTDSASTADRVQQAFNDLATAYFYSTETLEYLNEETAESIVKQLEEMGVANAQEVVYDELNAKTEALTLQKKILADTGIDVMNATNDVVTGLLKEAGATDIARIYLFNLVAQEQIFSNNTLNTSDKVKQLQELATAYGQTAVAARIAAMQEMYANNHMPVDNANILAAAQAEISNAISNVNVDFKGAGGGKKSGGSSGSSKDLHKEAYEKELKELERMHKLGLISDEDYWKARMDLNEHYFGESSGMHEKYLEEYQKNEEDILEGIKKLWEDYYDERKNNLKDLISYAEKLYDKEIDSLEANIKVLEEKRDAEKKQWQEKIDAIGDEIDALEDANDERERAIDLQNRQWALQKAMHQRAILLYSENGGMRYVNDSKAERDAKNDLDNTAQASANAAEKIQNTATALNNLSNEVSGYQLPELNSENFMLFKESEVS